MKQSPGRYLPLCRAVALVLSLLPALPAGAVTPEERAALLAIYDATGGPSWKNKSGWGGPPGTECSWAMVTCSTDGSVVNLFLGSNNLAGTIPAAIGDLTRLQRLYMGNNALAGPIPPQIGALTSLTELVLGTNQLGGTIPPQIGALTNLRLLHLYSNAFDGSIPASFSGLTNLQELALYDNRLTGGIPDLSRLTALTRLHLRINRLSGSIPPLASLTNLKDLLLDSNELTGSIPPLSGLASLERLYLNQNRLTGTIPDLASLTSLSELFLNTNQLSGPIPPSIGTLANLRFVVLANNQLSGSIPALGALRRLEILDLSTNQLSGSIPADLGSLPALQRMILSTNSLSGAIPDLGGLTQLRVLYLGRNQLSGPIPPSIVSLTALEDFRVNVNQLSGPIPAGIGRLSNLLVLDLSTNQLSGPVPPEIVNLAKLRELYLTKNALTGSFLSELSKMTALTKIYAGQNQLEGSLPPDIGKIAGLTQILLFSNKVGGPIPESIGDLTELTNFELGANQFTGAIPASLGRLTKLQKLYLNANRLTGPIPAALANCTSLIDFNAYGNQLSGPIPLGLERLTNLTILTLGANALTGTIPEGLGRLSKLQQLNLFSNRLSGTIPPALGDLAALQILTLATNELGGSIPPELGRLTKLKQLLLTANRLEGAIPREIGALSDLEKLSLDANQLAGIIPAELANLQKLTSLNLRFNALTAADPALIAFLVRLQPEWAESQNVPPVDVTLAGIDATSAVLAWKTVSPKSGHGGYQIAVASPAGSPLAVQQTTAGKWVSSAVVTGLTPSTDYTFAVRTVTYPFSGTNLDRPYQQNQLVSDYAPPITSRTASAIAMPYVVVLAFPSGPLIRGLGVDRDDRYVLINIGREPTAITLSQTGTFFTQSPSSFTLAPGASRTVTLRATDQAPGVYEGTSIPSGLGVPSGLAVPVSMLSLSLGSANIVAVPSATRVDLSTSTSGSVDFRNEGTDTLAGVLVSDADWIEPQTRGLIEIRPGQQVTLRFNVNRSKRPALDGSLTGGLYLVYPKSAAAALAMLADPLGSHANLGVSTVSVVDTPRPPVAPGAPPPLGAREVALFVPGVGTIRGPSARYISDINLVNASGGSDLSSVRVYYTPESASASQSRADLPPLPPNTLVSYGNVITTVFQSESTGTLQIRAPAGTIDNLTVSARIFNVEGRNGTFGTAIPVFRSDRGAAAGEEIVLTGVRKTATARTNLFIQEMSGNPARFDIRFLDRDGVQIGSYSGDVAPFSLRRVLDQVPAGATTALVVSSRDSAGVIAAYATPLDARSNDFWGVVDWSRHLGFDRGDAVVIPVAGSLRGVNDTFFRSDLTISNRSTLPQKGILRFISRSARTLERAVELPAGSSFGVDDLLGDSFRIGSDAGYLLFAPACDASEESLGPGGCGAAFALASRNFATVGADPGTFGTAVPALALDSALRAGQSRMIGGLEDVASSRGPGTYRTNTGLLETAGAAVTVRVTIIRPQTSGATSYVTGASIDVSLGPREQRQINGIAVSILGAGSEVRNASLLFQVLSGDGAVLVFTSSIDNGTGDAVLRVE